MRKSTRPFVISSDLDAAFLGHAPGREAGLIPLGDDVAGDISTTAVLRVGHPATVNTIETIGDLDFYKVHFEAGKTYEIDLFGKSGGPNLVPLSDAYLELYDKNGDLITSADGGASTTINTANDGFDAILTYTATKTGTYYVNARAFDNSPADGTNGDLVGDYELSARDVTNEPRYVPYYSPDSPLYAIDWGTRVNKVHQTYANPDGDEGTRDTGNAQSAVDPGAAYGHPGKNVITIYFAKQGEIITSVEDPTTPGLPPVAIETSNVTQYEHDAVMTALHEFEKVADVVYVEVQSNAEADFEYASYKGTPGPGVSLLGSMEPPDEPNEGLALFNSADERWNALNLAQGGFSFVTLIHEIGHGHGLAHPHDNGGHSGIMNGVEAEGAGVADYTTGDFELNQSVFTMMSYEDGWQSSPYGNAPTDVGYGYLGSLMAFDIAAIQDKYGVNEDWATGDDTYVLKDVNAPGTYFSSIWDAGGRDAIVYHGDKDALIDLRPATLQYENGGGGYVSYAFGIYGGYTIANGVTIERGHTGAGDDMLIGNGVRNVLGGGMGDDVLDGGLGNDRLNGGAGQDTAAYLLAEQGVHVDLSVHGQQRTGAGVDRLNSIENVTGSHFDDHLTGTEGRNVLSGDAGADVLAGGDDNDTLVGGAGVDRLIGGRGFDTFVFDDGDTGATRETADTIVKLQHTDRIDLSGIDAVASTADADDAFTFVGAAAFSGAAGELRLVVDGAAFTLLGDTDGDGVADLMILGTGTAPTADHITL